MHLLCLCLFVAGAAPDAPGKPTPKFEPGRDTTFVDGPLDKAGYIDYEAALNARLNARLKGKTTPDSNALVLLLKCIGPKPEGTELKPDFFKALGIDAPPADGQYLAKYHLHFALEIRAPDPRGFYDHEAKLKRQPWTKDDSPKHAEWLNINEKPLVIAVEATRRPDYFSPMISRKPNGERGMLIGALLPVVQKYRDIASVLGLRVTWNLGAGKFDEACADALAIHRLGRLAARGGSFIELLVGIAIDGLAHAADAVIFEHGRPTAKQALAYQAELMKLAPIAGPADRIALHERFLFLDAIQYSIKSGTAVPAGEVIEGLTAEGILKAIDWEAVFRKGNGYYDRIGASYKIPTRIGRLAAFKALDADLKNLEARVKNPKIDPTDPPAKIRAEVTEIIASMYLYSLMPSTAWNRSTATASPPPASRPTSPTTRNTPRLWPTSCRSTWHACPTMFSEAIGCSTKKPAPDTCSTAWARTGSTTAANCSPTSRAATTSAFACPASEIGHPAGRRNAAPVT